ncbi:hypothetical protein BDW22DRAFT_1322409 [Trametopsis cervina]|nr:hypothetical protein BDW22DRAFT_1322409 [Trametopsis cervina]
MHLCSLNVADLIIPLWRGTFACTLPDHRDTWSWAVFKDNTLWRNHGRTVAQAKSWLPGSFDRPPRNIAEKLNSGYKAIEFLTYLYGLGPALLYGVLPSPYWEHFCKLVRGVRLLHQRTITQDELAEGHQMLLAFCDDFEELYYQRNPKRLHFCRPCIHSLAHIASETQKNGPYVVRSQWTLERTIGILGGQIRQDSDPYANLAQRALRQCQVNALKHILPMLDPDPVHLPRGACDVGNGYVLLRYADRYPQHVDETQSALIRAFATEYAVDASAEWLSRPRISRWARLRLPNGQIARAWKEKEKSSDRLRTSRNVKPMKIIHKQRKEYAEVHYYFQVLMCNGSLQAFAMISIFEPPNIDLLNKSASTFWSCRHPGNVGLTIIPIQSIQSVVAVIPHPTICFTNPTDVDYFQDRYYVVEKLGLDVDSLGGSNEEDEEDEN